MIRIVHVSDLHILKPGAAVAPNKERSLWDKIKAHTLQELGVEINVGSHDPFRLDALDQALADLNPFIILVTGDVTTYGDRESMEYALEKLTEWKRKYKHVYCVPGNHDALQERFQQLFKEQRIFQTVPSLFKSFQNVLRGALADGSGKFLDSYERTIAANLECPPDPSQPKWVETPWGWLCIFLFNSVNDPGWMANEGRIGPRQYVQLNKALKSEEWKERESKTIRIALLHHHPLPIPYDVSGAAERAYDDMRDGSTLCYHLNKNKFHFVLHGHKHIPYLCRVQYEGDGNLYVMSAGTATQSNAPQSNASFNVLDLLSPFECIVHRYEYHSPTGFEENPACLRKIEPSVSALSFGYALEEEADVDLRNIAKVNIKGYEDQHSFQRIEWNVQFTPDWDYYAQYRLKGVSLVKNSIGILQVITGSPGHTRHELKLRAWPTHFPNEEIYVELIEDRPRQKCFRLRHPEALSPGQEFDYTYEFHWKNEAPDATFFDAFNLYYYARDIDEISYAISLPYKPYDARVERRGTGVDDSSIKLQKSTTLHGFRYSFVLAKPDRLVYVVRLPRLTGADA